MDINAKGKMQKAKLKVLQFAICSVQFAILLSGCATWQLDGEITRGRLELLYGDPKVALAHFQRAAQLDPDYRLNFTILREGVWTYVGRAHYAAGGISDARKALETARSRHADDDVAKLYLGLVLGREGDQQRGLREIDAGLRGIADWLDYIEFYHPWGHYWDPTKKIRGEARRNLAMTKGDGNWKELIPNVEWLAREIEMEIDRTADDRRQDWERAGDSNQP